MNRDELKDLSALRIREARILLRNNCFDGAYYLAGYSVECALKACIAKQVRLHDFPDKDLAFKSYSHVMGDLVKVAGLDVERQREERNNPDFAVNWSIVQRWRETSRYEIKSKQEAEDLFTSIITRKGGILRWIQQHW
jgi:hypothetical protein